MYHSTLESTSALAALVAHSVSTGHITSPVTTDTIEELLSDDEIDFLVVAGTVAVDSNNSYLNA
jgi:hypothetical protein